MCHLRRRAAIRSGSAHKKMPLSSEERGCLVSSDGRMVVRVRGKLAGFAGIRPMGGVVASRPERPKHCAGTAQDSVVRIAGRRVPVGGGSQASHRPHSAVPVGA